MNNPITPCVVVMTIEIEIPGHLPEELQDAIADDLCAENNLDRLQNLIKRWAGWITGENCHVAIDVE